MGDIFDPKFHKVWDEALIKEKKVRLKWHKEHGTKLKDTCDASDVDEAEESEQPCTCKNKEGKSKSFGKRFDWPRKGATGTNTLVRVIDPPYEMKMPHPILKNKLYEGISHHGEGRKKYLKMRWKDEGPDERYFHRMCTSWDYGWNHGKPNELSCTDPENCKIKERISN
ncbi:uncharacterized protein TNIN_371801 [Trichonephila inaurata madagascariensis]|uniref:Sperm microtubule inner protein 1 C-terminal domain-containing protein n=1 Tax=Trichonephila inaurata madagascariensis TaxID=2747483 RepID=A0A8X6JKV8_9ARAC|nr:uncharacterized protein TNIN_371801 [Trichonephila inaurata madagascariensis]